MNTPATSAAELDDEWLSRALGTEVRSVTLEPIGTGQTSSTYRLTLDAVDCPSSLVAKLAEGDGEARRRVATAHRSEVGFYRHVAPRLEVPVPACRYAAISDDGASFTLLLEDLSPRRQGRQNEGCSLLHATLAMENLARLHASHWNDQALGELDFLVPLTEERAAFLATVIRIATDAFIARYALHLEAADVATLRAVAAVLCEWQLNHPEPFSLVHGDYRLDNLLLHPAGDDVVVVDWQTLMIALPARDVAYFIGTSLPVEQRRTQESQLLSAYHEGLQARGVEDYSADRLTHDYRVGQLHGPMITVLGSLTSSGTRSGAADEMFLSMARRACAAVRELGSLEVA
jgi:Ser/Thr protein kinase RdoA (MazF antagonist)